MVEFLYTTEYKFEKPLSETDKPGEPAFHALLYAAGDKYGIPTLKTYAKDKYKRCFYNVDGHTPTEELHLADLHGFCGSIPIIFKTTPESDIGLRNVATEIMHVYAYEFDVWENEGWECLTGARRNIMKEVPEFAVGVYELMIKKRKVACIRCRKKV